MLECHHTSNLESHKGHINTVSPIKTQDKLDLSDPILHNIIRNELIYRLGHNLKYVTTSSVKHSTVKPIAIYEQQSYGPPIHLAIKGEFARYVKCFRKHEITLIEYSHITIIPNSFPLQDSK